jgi:hypothetical protein
MSEDKNKVIIKVYILNTFKAYISDISFATNMFVTHTPLMGRGLWFLPKQLLKLFLVSLARHYRLVTQDNSFHQSALACPGA